MGQLHQKNIFLSPTPFHIIESTSKCKLFANLGVMFEKDFIWCFKIYFSFGLLLIIMHIMWEIHSCKSLT